MNNSEIGQKNKNMQAVKNKDSKIELLLRHELWARGVRYRKNDTKFMGKPILRLLGKRWRCFVTANFGMVMTGTNRKIRSKQTETFGYTK